LGGGDRGGGKRYNIHMTPTATEIQTEKPKNEAQNWHVSDLKTPVTLTLAQKEQATPRDTPKRNRKEERLQRARWAGIKDPESYSNKELTEKLKSLMAHGKIPDRRKTVPPSDLAGRKTTAKLIAQRGLQLVVEQHANETVRITIFDKRSGKTVELKRPRVIIALEKLFTRATKGEGETAALEKWLDRALGKPQQAVALKHSGALGNYKSKKQDSAARAGIAAYEREILKGL